MNFQQKLAMWSPQTILPVKKVLVLLPTPEETFVKEEPEETAALQFRQANDFLETVPVKVEAIDSLPDSTSNRCCLCPEGLKLQRLLIQHYQRFHPGVTRNFVHLCDCEDGINLHESLTNHLLSHFLTPRIIRHTKPQSLTPIAPKPKPKLKHVCELCPDESFETEIKWNNHQVECHFKDNAQITKLTCCKCFKSFASRIKLYHHMMRHREPEFSCDLCGKKSNSKYKMKIHLFTHFRRKWGQDSEEFKNPNHSKTMCYVCSKMVQCLTQHMYLRHSEEKRFKCNEPGCSFACKTKRSMQQHQNLHTGSRPHVCEFCGKKFATQSGLTSHRYRHTDPEKFKCLTCGECFGGQVSLQGHKARNHPENEKILDVRPFACTFEGCVASFAKETNMKVHFQNVHNKIFLESKCKVCPFVTNRPVNLRAHMKRFHCIKKGVGRLYPPQKKSDGEKDK